MEPSKPPSSTGPNIGIPPELWSRMFYECLPPNDDILMESMATKAMSQPILSSLLSICQVCRLWRTIALSTPALWTRISIKGGPEALESRLPFIDQCLHHSGSLPITLHIGYDGEDGAFPPMLLTAALDNKPLELAGRLAEIILAHRSRLRELLLQGSLVHYLLEHLLGPGASGLHFPSFERLHVIGFSSITHNYVLRIGAHVPALKSMRLRGTIIEAIKCQVPWSQLKEIHLSTQLISLREFCQILMRSPLIEHGSFFISLFTDIFIPEQRMDAPLLRSLRIACMGGSSRALSSIRTPALTELFVVPWAHTQDKDSLLELVEVSGCVLRRLSIWSRHGTMLSSSHVELVNALPHLLELQEKNEDIDARHLEGVRETLDARRQKLKFANTSIGKAADTLFEQYYSER